MRQGACVGWAKANPNLRHSSTQILILIFAEVLGLYGLITALILNTRAQDAPQC